MPELPDDWSPALPLEPACRSPTLSGTGQCISIELTNSTSPEAVLCICLALNEITADRRCLTSRVLCSFLSWHGNITRSRHDGKSRSATLYKALAIKRSVFASTRDVATK